MFSKKPADELRTAAIKAPSRSMANSSTFSVIGADVTIKGDVTATADLHVDGRIEGDMTCASLVQGESSEIHGAVVAENARLAGRIVGSINARELVVLRSARIEGDVRYDALTIEQGAEVDGRFSHRTTESTDSITAATSPEPKPKDVDVDGEPKLSLAG